MSISLKSALGQRHAEVINAAPPALRYGLAHTAMLALRAAHESEATADQEATLCYLDLETLNEAIARYNWSKPLGGDRTRVEPDAPPVRLKQTRNADGASVLVRADVDAGTPSESELREALEAFGEVQEAPDSFPARAFELVVSLLAQLTRESEGAPDDGPNSNEFTLAEMLGTVLKADLYDGALTQGTANLSRSIQLQIVAALASTGNRGSIPDAMFHDTVARGIIDAESGK